MATFPTMDEEAGTLIRHANELTLLARQMRAHAASGNAACLRAVCQQIGAKGEVIADACGLVSDTSDNIGGDAAKAG